VAAGLDAPPADLDRSRDGLLRARARIRRRVPRGGRRERDAGSRHSFSSLGDFVLQFAFSRDGELFAYSSPDPDPKVEVLRAVRTRDAATAAPQEVLRGVTSWALSNDDQKVYFYREDAPAERGLYVASFPGGQDELKLGEKIRDYLVVGWRAKVDQGVAYLTTVNPNLTTFALLRDSRAPTTAVDVFSYRGQLEGVRLSRDLRFTTWLDARLTGRVVRNADLQSCQLNREDSAAYDPQFLTSSGLVFWSEDGEDDSFRRDQYYAHADGCTGRTIFAQGIEVFHAVEGRGVVFGDEFDSNERTVTLKYAHATPASEAGPGGVGPPIRLAENVESTFVLVGSNPMFIVYKTKGGAKPDASYVFGPVPF
jgi:hypothetical protein